MDTGKTNWVISIIACDDGEHTVEYKHLEKSILFQKRNDAIKYIIYYYDINVKVGEVKVLEYDSARDPGFTTIHKAIEDIYDLDTLKNFFNRFVKQCPSEKLAYMTVTWGHGAGIGFFGRLTELAKKSGKTDARFLEGSFAIDSIFKKRNDFINLQANLSIKIDQEERSEFLNKNFLSPISESIEKFNFKDVIPAKELEEAQFITAYDFSTIIKDSIGYTDVVVCTNCYMQMIETGLALSANAGLIIASQTTIPFDGINYKKLFELIHMKPASDFDEIGECSIDFFKLKYQEEPYKTYWNITYPQFDFNLVSVSANRLDNYKSIIAQLNDFVNTCLREFNEEGGADLKLLIRAARRKCFTLTEDEDSNIIDLMLFFKTLVVFLQFKKDDFLELIKIIKLICNSRNNYNIAIYSPEKLSDLIISPSSIREKSPSGLSIFFPAENDSDISKFLKENYKREKDPSGFIKATNWDLFLIELAK